MYNESFIRTYSNAASKELCKKSIDTFEKIIEKSELYKDFVVNKRASNRNDISINLLNPAFNENILRQELLEIINNCFLQYQTDPGLTNYSGFVYENVHCKIQRTLPSGGFHAFHCETKVSNEQSASYRELAWMLYLNDMPNGEAETEFYYQRTRLKPVEGTVVIWPAGFTHLHRGNTVFTQPKYIATGWIYCKPINMASP